MSPLSVTGLGKRFVGRPPVLSGIDLRLDPGELVVVCGRNGSGKSTLLACVAGVVIPDAGTIAIDGHDLVREPIAARACLRYLPQEPDLPEGVTGRELLGLLADAFAAAPALPEALEATELGESLDLLGTTYSVGMRKRLLLAGLWLGTAALFVLDEPFAGLDTVGRERTTAEIARRRAAGAAFLVSAHADEQALLALASRRLDL